MPSPFRFYFSHLFFEINNRIFIYSKLEHTWPKKAKRDRHELRGEILRHVLSTYSQFGDAALLVAALLTLSFVICSHRHLNHSLKSLFASINRHGRREEGQQRRVGGALLPHALLRPLARLFRRHPSRLRLLVKLYHK